jgi:uncharacterized membrane protein
MRRGRLIASSDWWLGAAGVAYLGWILLWLYGQFATGAFAYHDLTIVNDLFSNGWLHGRPLWGTDAGASHLAIHFTPTLLLWMPAFLPFQTQFALLAVVAVTFTLALVVWVRDVWTLLARSSMPRACAIALTVSTFVAFGFNRYTLRVLSSGHYEPLMLLPAVILLVGLRRGAGLRWLVPIVLVALGIRQDAGLFLFALVVSCRCAPSTWVRPSWRSVASLAGVCVIYVMGGVLVALPWFGNDGDTRFWSSWGGTWPEVVTAWISQPGRVIDTIWASAFGAWNAELLYLPVLNVFAWAINQLPAVLFYTADTVDKRQLWYYNASFMLPGLMLGFALAQLHLAAAVERMTGGRAMWRHAGYSVVAILCGVAAASAAYRSPTDSTRETLRVGSLARTDPFARAPLRDLVACRDVRSVAADFHTIVYAPLYVDKYLPVHARRADLVVVRRTLDRVMPGDVPPQELAADLTTGGRYRLVASVADVDVFLSRRVTGCG